MLRALMIGTALICGGTAAMSTWADAGATPAVAIVDIGRSNAGAAVPKGDRLPVRHRIDKAFERISFGSFSMPAPELARGMAGGPGHTILIQPRHER